MTASSAAVLGVSLAISRTNDERWSSASRNACTSKCREFFLSMPVNSAVQLDTMTLSERDFRLATLF